jgi:hypothetical protein
MEREGLGGLCFITAAQTDLEAIHDQPGDFPLRLPYYV